jgi:hypothetical protein
MLDEFVGSELAQALAGLRRRQAELAIGPETLQDVLDR